MGLPVRLGLSRARSGPDPARPVPAQNERVWDAQLTCALVDVRSCRHRPAGAVPVERDRNRSVGHSAHINRTLRVSITRPASRGLATPGPTSPPASASAARPHSSAGEPAMTGRPGALDWRHATFSHLFARRSTRVSGRRAHCVARTPRSCAPGPNVVTQDAEAANQRASRLAPLLHPC